MYARSSPKKEWDQIEYFKILERKWVSFKTLMQKYGEYYFDRILRTSTIILHNIFKSFSFNLPSFLASEHLEAVYYQKTPKKVCITWRVHCYVWDVTKWISHPTQLQHIANKVTGNQWYLDVFLQVKLPNIAVSPYYIVHWQWPSYKINKVCSLLHSVHILRNVIPVNVMKIGQLVCRKISKPS